MISMKLMGGTLAAVLLVQAHALADAPALTPGQAVEVREGDIWSGATIEKKEGRKYQVKYGDGTEEWVSPDRIRAKDGASAPVTGGGSTPGAGGGSTSSGISPDGPFTQVRVMALKRPPRRADSVLVIPPATHPATAFTDLTPATDPGLGHIEDLLLCADTPGVVVAVGQRHDDDTSLLVIDTNKSACEARTLSVHDHKILSAADGGRILLTQPNSSGLSLHVWQYSDGKYQLKQNFIFVADGKNKKPDWARLISPTRLLFRSGFGETYVIDLSLKEQVAYLQCGDLNFHCSGKFILSKIDQNIVVLRPSDLSVFMQLPNGQDTAIDATGTLFAVGDSHSMKVMKLPAKTEIGHVTGIDSRGKNDLLSATALFTESSTYYDIKTGIPVWTYHVKDGKSMLMPNGQVLFVAAPDGDTTVSLATLPDAAAAGALAATTPEKFVITPGAHIALAGDLSAFGDAVKARANLEHSLAGSGHKLDDTAQHYKLTVTTAPGPTEKFATRENVFGPPVVREHDAPSTISTFDLTLDGTSIWHNEMKFSAGFMLLEQPGETLEQALAKAGKPDINRLNFLDIPGYIIKGAGDNHSTLGSSTLTRAGFTEDGK